MKKIYLFLLLFAITCGLNAASGFDVTYSEPQNDAMQLDFTLDGINLVPVTLNGTTYTKIETHCRLHTEKSGWAELPLLTVPVQLAANKDYDLVFTGGDYIDYHLDFPLVPSRGVIYRDQDPSTIPYVIDPNSMTDRFFPGDRAQMVSPYIIKDVRGTTVSVFPFQYNAVTNTLRVYQTMTVQLVENNGKVTNPLLVKNKPPLREMIGIYESVFINFEPSGHDLSIADHGEILVICTARDEVAIQPYIDWKTEKGYVVHKEVVATGTNVDGLVQDKYDANNNILYIMLVGDWADIKCANSGGTPQDPVTGCVVGNDNYFDICVGRFSANAAADVTAQVNKIINYEKNPDPGATWYTAATGIASNQGTGDDDEYDNEQIDVIWFDKLDPFTYASHTPIYDPSANSTMVSNALNAGTGIINYCGHGSSTSWGSSGFSNSHIANLTNGNKLPFIFSVACVNGAYHSTTCFAEAWMRKVGGGAVGTVMSTINQPWDPPMRGQDYFNDMVIGGYDYSLHPGQNGITTTEGRHTFGSIVFNGLLLMITESPGDLNTAQTWILFGDPALQIRTDTPAGLSYSSDVILFGTPYETMVTSSGLPVEGALVALSQDGVVKSGFTDATGFVSIDNEFLAGDVQIVITAFNTETVVETIQCAPPAGPYVVFSSYEINDLNGNNNGILEYFDGNVLLGFAMKNLSGDPATNVSVTISTSDEFVTISDDTENFGNFLAGEIKTIDNAFAFDIAEDVPEGRIIVFDVVAVGDGDGTWESNFTIMAHTALPDYNGFEVDDPGGNNNGILDPGETATINISVTNNGSADVIDLFGELTSSDAYVTINTSGPQAFGNISSGGAASAGFEVTVDLATPAGHNVAFGFEYIAGFGITGTGEFTSVIGQIPVLIVDMDENNNSADKIQDALNGLSIPSDYITYIPSNLELYTSVFVCLGIYSNNHVLSSTEGQQLAGYLNNGGMLYMEGGDTWAYDNATAVHGMFGIIGEADGTGDLGPVTGINGTITEGMDFTYTGDNSWIDHLGPTGNGEVILQNSSPSYNTGIINDAGSYKTIGASHEFGGLSGDRTALMGAYLEFFGVIQPMSANFVADITTPAVGESVQFTNTSTGSPDSFLWGFEGGDPGTSTEENPLVVYGAPGSFDVSLTVTSGTTNSTEVKENYITVVDQTQTQIINIPAGWSGLSSCLIPEDTDINAIFQEVMADVVMLQNMGGVYYPEMGVNTIGQWDNHEGYKIKVVSDITLNISGWTDPSNEIELNNGWNLVPVLSECDVQVDKLFNDVAGAVVLVKEVAGPGIYWPLMNINTLGWLKPGKAYFVKVTENVTVGFPGCD